MIQVNVLYPNGPQASFDFGYYRETHLPLVAELLGDVLKDTGVVRGVSGGAQNESAPYIAIGSLQFASVEDFQAAFAPHAERILADLPNFTNTEPVIQVSDML
ncbi:EthD family reductase [Cobetia sp. SIMBA_158]|uniref:EthD family reductase n=1 Tax=Cobetia sp. SIMBA_158 TaxID=3081617 RepID=UPI000D1A8D73|nr:EthD family reductase [Halomonas sp. SF2003]